MVLQWCYNDVTVQLGVLLVVQLLFAEGEGGGGGGEGADGQVRKFVKCQVFEHGSLRREFHNSVTTV
jgi:hypothetical protein